MKKWAVLGLVAALAVGGGVAWVLAGRAGSDPSGIPSLAERIASLGHEPATDNGLLMDRCFNLQPLTDASGALTPELAAFPARLLDKEFELTDIRFGDLCYEATPTKMLETEWKHPETGVEVLVDQYPGTNAPTRIAPASASFSDAGYEYYILSISQLTQARDGPSPANLLRGFNTVVEQLRPPAALRCFYRAVSKDWADLASVGIGDPRGAVPPEYSALRLEFTALEQPETGCPETTRPPAVEPAVQFQAMFSGPGSSLLAIFAHSLTPDEVETPATFGPGGAGWKNGRFRFSMNWAPEHVSDAQARAIAAALDPGFGAVCAPSARRVEFAELQQPNVREPVRPGGLASGVMGTFVLIGRTSECADGGRDGFQAHWVMEYRDRGALVDVTALRGEQLPYMRPMVFEGKTLYWMRPDGIAFYVSGLKAEFSRDELLGVARSVDPTFDETLLTVPPPP